jgi:hypothetical protein
MYQPPLWVPQAAGRVGCTDVPAAGYTITQIMEAARDLDVRAGLVATVYLVELEGLRRIDCRLA